MAEKSSWGQANRRQKHGLVWRNRKKISQIIKAYFYLPFFLLIILWYPIRKAVYEVNASVPLSRNPSTQFFYLVGMYSQE